MDADRYREIFSKAPSEMAKEASENDGLLAYGLEIVDLWIESKIEEELEEEIDEEIYSFMMSLGMSMFLHGYFTHRLELADKLNSLFEKEEKDADE